MATAVDRTTIPRDPGEKLGAAVARRIESDIFDRGWPVGTVLGSEADLIETFGVSRAVLREAVRLLEHRQVATMRRGPGGGLVVTEPAAAVIVEVIATYLDFVEVTPAELFEARSALEQVAARLAAENITEDGIDKLRASLDQSPGLEGAGRFHVGVAERSGNTALTLFIQALTSATGYRLDPSAISDRQHQESEDAHARIVDAIASGQAGVAEQRMAEHLSETAWTAQAAAAPPGRGSTARLDQRTAWRRAKLPERLAHRIKTDILRRGWPVGEVIGSEADLLVHYDVSRAVFREAVRILEYYGVAEMRRGPHGGLVVREPDLARIVDVVSIYLEHLGLDRERFHEVRDAVELWTIVRAAEQITPEGVQRLREVLAIEAATTPEDVAEVSQALHLVLADLAQNRPMAFFTRVMTRMTTTHVASARRASARDRETYASEVAAVHARIVDAVISGDPAVARHRMLRHLAALSPFIDEAPGRARPAKA